jgi:flagellar motor switch protein FliM
MSERPVLSPEEVAGVLAGGEVAAAPAGPTPYSFREPIAIPKEAEPEARKRVDAAAAEIQETLRTELGAEVGIEVDAFQQQRAAAAVSAIPPPAWLLSFAKPGGGGVALVLPAATALALLERALGGAGAAAETSRGPTALESRVMARILPRMAAALGKALGVELASAGLGVGELSPQVATPGEVLGVGLLRVRQGEGERSALLLASAPLLVPPKARAASVRGIGPLASALGPVRLEARPVLDAGLVMVSELAELEPGTVLRFDVAEDAALDLRVRSLPIFAGRIVRDAQGGSAFAVARRFRRARIRALKEQA